MRFFLFFIIATSLFARSYIMSAIPSVTNEVLDVSVDECYSGCQHKLLDKGFAFSFLAKYKKSSSDSRLKNAYQELQSLLNLSSVNVSQETRHMRVALLVPTDVIGRYASAVIDSINSYLLSKDISFEVRVYDCKTEDEKSLQKQIDTISKDGFKYVVAPLTTQGAQNLANLKLPFIVYVPTVNKNDISNIANNIVYGGIDYKLQIRKLLEYAPTNKIVVFEEPIALSRKITSFSFEALGVSPDVVQVSTRKTNFKRLFEKANLDENTTIIINTRPVLTSLILSQLTYHDVNVSRVLSTQLNYTSLVLRLTQSKDLDRLFVANSISSFDDKIYEANRLFNNNIAFDWVVYSSTIMADLIMQRSKRDFSSRSKAFGIDIFDNSLVYDINVFKVWEKRFIKTLDADKAPQEKNDVNFFD